MTRKSWDHQIQNNSAWNSGSQPSPSDLWAPPAEIFLFFFLSLYNVMIPHRLPIPKHRQLIVFVGMHDQFKGLNLWLHVGERRFSSCTISVSLQGVCEIWLNAQYQASEVSLEFEHSYNIFFTIRNYFCQQCNSEHVNYAPVLFFFVFIQWQEDFALCVDSAL